MRPRQTQGTLLSGVCLWLVLCHCHSLRLEVELQKPYKALFETSSRYCLAWSPDLSRLVLFVSSLGIMFMAHISIRWGLWDSGTVVPGSGCHGKKLAHVGVCSQLIYVYLGFSIYSLRLIKYRLKHPGYCFVACLWIQSKLNEVVCRKYGRVWQPNRARKPSQDTDVCGQMDLVTTYLIHGRFIIKEGRPRSPW